MAMRRTYMKIGCPDCGRQIGRNNIEKHRRSCQSYKDRVAQERITWAKQAPIEELTIGLARDTGRWEEFTASLRKGAK